MQTLSIQGARLECDVKGSGDPLLLIHGSICADNLLGLTSDPAVVSSHRVISYHRRGFAGSDRAPVPFSIAQQAADARAVLRHFGISRAHVAGYSYGGVIALQLAKDAPESVASLALLEPALEPARVGPPFWEAFAPTQAMYDRGDKVAAMCVFLEEIALGPQYREIVDRTLPPGAFEQAIADVDTFFQVEMNALEQWRFTSEDAKRIRQPLVSVVGEESPPAFWENHALIRQWMPQAEELTIPRANHGFPHTNPSALAVGLARFLRGRRL
jgi:pimeloyl-ACP methyl ester carboxylesterase